MDMMFRTLGGGGAFPLACIGRMTPASKTIGLLGGMSWESSIEYERIINTVVRDRLGGTHSADLIVRSYDFACDREAAGRGTLGRGRRPPR